MTDPEMQDDYPSFDESRVEEAFRDGLRTAREYMARFVEQGGDAQTAASIRANWNPAWGADEGQMTGEQWIDPWGMTVEMLERSRARTEAAMRAAEDGLCGRCHGSGKATRAEAATPALALTASCLRAIAANQEISS